jgi:hypothetical protein
MLDIVKIDHMGVVIYIYNTMHQDIRATLSHYILRTIAEKLARIYGGFLIIVSAHIDAYQHVIG